jgi:Spy/CpxP family protein refolding chaperone
MKNRTRFAALLLSAALIAAPGLAVSASAHEGMDKQGEMSRPMSECHHMHFTDAQRTALHETMKQFHEENKAAFEEMHQLYKARHAILAAQNFDKGAFLAVTAQIEKKHEQLAQSRVQAFVFIADKFTPEQREMLVRMMGHHRHGMHHAMWHEGEGHEGWHHHDGMKADEKKADQPAPMSDKGEYPPYDK